MLLTPSSSHDYRALVTFYGFSLLLLLSTDSLVAASGPICHPM